MVGGGGASGVSGASSRRERRPGWRGRRLALVGPVVAWRRWREAEIAVDAALGAVAKGPSAAPVEVMTVSDDEAVLFAGTLVWRQEGLEPDREYSAGGVSWRTLPRPPGERLATVATINDVHFGEDRCGLLEGVEIGPVLASGPGEEPYPDVMNRAAASEIAAACPDAVVAKGDLTASGSSQEYARFEQCYRPALGERLHVTRGNHDNRATGSAFEVPEAQEVAVPGAVLAILDTSRAGRGGGSLSEGQLDWLDELAARADRPVLAFGHHPCWAPEEGAWAGEGAALDPASSRALVEVVSRRRTIAGYFAGHTHRNRVRRFEPSGAVPFVEVACVKDFPGAWAEYRVFEGGLLQVHRRIASKAALSWSERCRAMFAGLYPSYALGPLEERCFMVGWRSR